MRNIYYELGGSSSCAWPRGLQAKANVLPLYASCNAIPTTGTSIYLSTGTGICRLVGLGLTSPKIVSLEQTHARSLASPAVEAELIGEAEG